MFEEVKEIVGSAGGPTSFILAGVHGDEIGGIAALKEVMPSLAIERGRVLYGFGNPRAIDQGVRYTDANLNRMFIDDAKITDADRESYEYQRAQFLKPYFEQADVLLDLHGTSIPNSKVFAICEDNATDIVAAQPVELSVSGFDDHEPGGTDYYMNKIGKVGICIECGYFGDKQAADIAKESINSFLITRGHIDGETVDTSPKKLQVYQKYYSKTDSFTLVKAFENFEPVRAGGVIGIDGKEEIMAPKDSVILFAHNAKKAGEEVFLLASASGTL